MTVTAKSKGWGGRPARQRDRSQWGYSDYKRLAETQGISVARSRLAQEQASNSFATSPGRSRELSSIESQLDEQHNRESLQRGRVQAANLENYTDQDDDVTNELWTMARYRNDGRIDYDPQAVATKQVDLMVDTVQLGRNEIGPVAGGYDTDSIRYVPEYRARAAGVLAAYEQLSDEDKAQISFSKKEIRHLERMASEDDRVSAAEIDKVRDFRLSRKPGRRSNRRPGQFRGAAEEDAARRLREINNPGMFISGRDYGDNYGAAGFEL